MPWCRAGNRGFTLIEILVVVAIMAIISALTVVRLDRSDSHRVADAAARMVTLLDAARDEAIASGRSVAISSDGEGCQFWQADEDRGEWLAFPVHDILVAQRLPNQVVWRSQTVNERSRPVGERIVFPPDGVVEPFALVLGRGEASIVLEMDAMGRIGLTHAENP